MSDELNRAAPIAAQLDREWVQRTWFECNQDLFVFAQAVEARRAAPVAAQLDAELPPLESTAKAMAEHSGWEQWDAATNFCHTPSGNEPEDEREYWRELAKLAVAPYAERIRLLERNQLPKLDADDEVVFPNDTGLAVVRAERYDQLREAEERTRLLERELAGFHQAVEDAKRAVEAYRAQPAKPAQTIDTPEFRRLINEYREACEMVRGHAIPQWRALIAYIDGRTAAPAPELRQAAQALIAAFDDPKCSIASVNNYVRDLERALGRTAGTAPEGEATALLREVDGALEAAWKARELPASVISGDLVRRYKAVLKGDGAASDAATEYEYELHQDDVMVVGTSGKDAFNEILRYAAQYVEYGPVKLYKIARTKITALSIPGAAPSPQENTNG